MRGLNKVQIIGNLGADPEMRYTPHGRAVTNFRVCVTRKWKDRSGELQEKAEWFRVVAWEKLAEIANQYLVKGSPVYVEGRLETNSYEDTSGQVRYTTEVVANDIMLLPRSGKQDSPPSAAAAPPPRNMAAEQDEDDSAFDPPETEDSW